MASEWDDVPDEQLLETPEKEWLSKIGQDRLAGIVRTHPEHGAREAVAKLTNVFNYGPEHHDSAVTLETICRAWPVTMADVLREAEKVKTGDEEWDAAFQRFVKDNAHVYGCH